jgi:raffinose synthase
MWPKPKKFAALVVLSLGTGFSIPSAKASRFTDLDRYLALALQGHFITVPTFGSDLAAIPKECQFLLWRKNDGTHACMVPLLDGHYRSTLRGTPEGAEIVADCGPAGEPSANIALAICCERVDPLQAAADAVSAAVAAMGRGRLRTEKHYPAWADELGWCTWDAFYADVDEEKVLAGLQSFRDAGVVPGQVILDDGWQDRTEKSYLRSYGLKPAAFTDGSLRSLIERAKGDFGVRLFGCWRTLFGTMRGVDVTSPSLSHLQSSLVHEPGTEADTFGVVHLPDVARFHDEYGAALAAQGVDFVKVDFQSALHLMTYPETGRSEAARQWQHALQDSTNRHFGGQLLNCMAMSGDQTYHTPHGNVCRASDDFFPGKDDSHPTHIRQNLSNSLWLGNLQWPDWDMFQSGHPWAEYHAMARAISGGPVYVSDKPGASDFALLARLVANDGRTLRCCRPALPTRDTVLVDALRERRLMKAQNVTATAGVLGVFHPDPDPGAEAIQETLRADDIVGLSGEFFVVYSLREGLLGVVGRGDALAVRLAPRRSDLLFFAPLCDGFAAIGLIEKFNPAAAITKVSRENNQVTVVFRSGGKFAFFTEVSPVAVTRDNEPIRWTESGLLCLVDSVGQADTLHITLASR